MMGERQRENNRRSSAAGWAWSISIIIHVFILVIFAFVKFSQSQGVEKRRIAPTTKVSVIKEFMIIEPVSPKPKVKKSIASSVGAAVDGQLPVRQIFELPKPILQNPQNVSKAAESAPNKMTVALSSSVVVSPKVEFFGSSAEGRKICYVVDCSGSMQGIFCRVQKELIKSVEGLEADHYFYVIFFASDKLYEYGDGRLMRATPQVKSAICKFIRSVRPAGTTNAMAALERAMQLRDAPAVIYFLTDGFELAGDSAYSFAQKVLAMRKNFAPATKINTIGFWVQGWDGKILEKIAKQSSGECILVGN